MQRSKYIIIFFSLLALTFLFLAGKVKYVPYKPVEDFTWNSGIYSITTRFISTYSIYSLPNSDEAYCKLVLGKYYQDPTITIHNTQTGESTKLTLKSEKPLVRISFLDQGQKQSNDISVIGIDYRDFTHGCNRKESHGRLIIGNNGRISSVKIPGYTENLNLYVIRNNIKVDIQIAIIPENVVISEGDFNHDGRVEYMILDTISDNKDNTVVYMIDLGTNEPAVWFNNGLPVKTEKNREEITKTYTSQGEFIMKYSN